MNSTSVAAALKEAYDPWSLPDSFTVYNFAPEEIHSFLLPHWKTQKAPHPMLYYFFGLLYLVIGNNLIKINVNIDILSNSDWTLNEMKQVRLLFLETSVSCASLAAIPLYEHRNNLLNVKFFSIYEFNDANCNFYKSKLDQTCWSWIWLHRIWCWWFVYSLKQFLTFSLVDRGVLEIWPVKFTPSLVKLIHFIFD